MTINQKRKKYNQKRDRELKEMKKELERYRAMEIKYKPAMVSYDVWLAERRFNMLQHTIRELFEENTND